MNIGDSLQKAGLALAFGLGGRPVAQRLLEDAYAKGRSDLARTRTTTTTAGTTGPVPDPRAGETDTPSMSYGRASSGATYREEPRPDEH